MQIKITDCSTHMTNLIDELSSADDQCPLLSNLIGTADLISSIIIKFRDLSLLFKSMPLLNHSNCLGKDNTGNTKNCTYHFNEVLMTSVQFYLYCCEFLSEQVRKLKQFTLTNFFSLNK